MCRVVDGEKEVKVERLVWRKTWDFAASPLSSSHPADIIELA
jgi:hypothetical protein